MYRRWAIGCISGILNILLIAGSVLAAPATQQADSDKGTTPEDLTRGLRSAAQNIEKDIPKIGPAIGKVVTSIVGTNSAKTKTPTQDSPSTKK
jgi:hypothetical protein